MPLSSIWHGGRRGATPAHRDPIGLPGTRQGERAPDEQDGDARDRELGALASEWIPTLRARRVETEHARPIPEVTSGLRRALTTDEPAMSSSQVQWGLPQSSLHT